MRTMVSGKSCSVVVAVVVAIDVEKKCRSRPFLFSRAFLLRGIRVSRVSEKKANLGARGWLDGWTYFWVIAPGGGNSTFYGKTSEDVSAVSLISFACEMKETYLTCQKKSANDMSDGFPPEKNYGDMPIFTEYPSCLKRRLNAQNPLRNLHVFVKERECVCVE